MWCNKPLTNTNVSEISPTRISSKKFVTFKHFRILSTHKSNVHVHTLYKIPDAFYAQLFFQIRKFSATAYYWKSITAAPYRLFLDIKSRHQPTKRYENMESGKFYLHLALLNCVPSCINLYLPSLYCKRTGSSACELRVTWANTQILLNGIGFPGMFIISHDIKNESRIKCIIH